MEVFAEVGVGNDTCLSTEYEKADGSEFRVVGFFIGDRIVSMYIRVWIGYQVLIVDTKEGIKFSKKNKKKFKVLFGVKSI